MDSRDDEFAAKLLTGCCHEADRCDTVAFLLEGLRRSLPENLQPHLAGLTGEITNTCRSLRDLVDLVQVQKAKVPAVIEDINVILPCLVKTLQDIETFYRDRSISKEQRWKRMYHELSTELHGTTLPARFILYNQYLQQLQLLVSKSQSFDLNGLGSLRERILQLRESRGIPLPSNVPQLRLMWYESMEYWREPTKLHWAESLFSQQPLATKTKLKNRKHKRSQALGPLVRMGQIEMPDSKIVLKMPFENDELSVTFLLQAPDDAPHVLIRTVQTGQPWVCIRGAHNLCISRHDESVVNLTRWSDREQCRKLWASLVFGNYEELVLFYYTFVSLKARSVRVLNMNPREFSLRREIRHFQAQIIDDGFNHSLAVYEDPYTRRHRLHASVWDDNLKHCPVWTAFCHLAEKRWIRQISPHRVWIRGIQPYVLCERYRPRKQRKGANKEFEVDFVHPEAATRFIEIFEGGGDLPHQESDSPDEEQI